MPAPSASTLPIATDVAGPASATANSAPGVGSSPSISATPPKRNNVMLFTRTPKRRATTACATSCTARQPKNATPVMAAIDSRSRRGRPGSTSPNSIVTDHTTRTSTANQETWIHSGIPSNEPRRRRKRRTRLAYGACVAEPGTISERSREAGRARDGLRA